MTWNRTRKRNRWGQQNQTARPAEEWLRLDLPGLRIVSDELWQAAHQKVLLDETWLSVLLSEPPAPSAQGSVEQSGGAQVGSTPTPSQTSLALSTSHSLRLPSPLPLASRLPSGLKARDVTMSVCACQTRCRR